MRIRSLSLALALAACAFADAASQAPARRAAAAPAAAARATRLTTVEGITEYSLPNGLRILLFPDQSKPTVTVNITYLVGSRHEGYGETGMAHLLEHLVFKGSKNHPNIPQELTDHGSRPNGTTWYDRTNYFETMPASDANLEWALDLEADRMVNSFIAKKDLESEFSVVRNEFEMGENDPFGVTLERVMDAAYRWHGYGRSTIGNKADIENVPIERLQAFYRKYYQPDNAVLVVAGKFDPAKALTLVEQKFGRIPRPRRTLENGNLLFATYTTEPTQDGERFVEVRRVGETQHLMMGYHIPAGSHPDFAPIAVLEDVLTNNPSGRLYKALVDGKYASSTNAFLFQLREPGMLIPFAELRMEQSLDSARAVMARVLDGVGGVTQEEVDRAKTALLKNIELALNNSETIGYALTEWAALGDWRLFFLHRDRIEKVTPADVQRVATAYLKPSNRTVAVFIPTKDPVRAEIPATPSIPGMIGDYKGRAAVAAGEAFDASPANIDARVRKAALPNGMQLTLLPKQTRGNRVNAQLVLRYGNEQTLMHRGMIAQFAAGLLSRGTTELTREQVKDSLNKLKAVVNIGGGGNNAVVTIETLRDNLVPVLELVADQVRSPRFDAAEFDKLRQEQLTAIEAQKSEPIPLAIMALQRKLTAAPKGHLYYVPTLDEMVADINAVTLDQVKAFHRELYGASAADLAIVGDFDPDAATAAATRFFGDWRNPVAFARVPRSFGPVDSTFQSIETPDKANAVYVAGQNLALRDDDPDYPAMVLADFMTGGGFLNSRLPTRLRQKEGISYAAGSQLQAMSLDRYTMWLGYAILAPQNIDRLTAAFNDELQRLRREGFTADEVKAARDGFLQARSQSRANDNELVGILVNRRYAGRTMTSYDAVFERQVQALTPEQVNAVVRKYLDPKKTAVVRAGDFAKNPAAKTTP